MLRGTRGESRPGEGAAILPSTTKSLWANDRRRPLFFFLVCAYWCLKLSLDFFSRPLPFRRGPHTPLDPLSAKSSSRSIHTRESGSSRAPFAFFWRKRERRAQGAKCRCCSGFFFLARARSVSLLLLSTSAASPLFSLFLFRAGRSNKDRKKSRSNFSKGHNFTL